MLCNAYINNRVGLLSSCALRRSQWETGLAALVFFQYSDLNSVKLFWSWRPKTETVRSQLSALSDVTDIYLFSMYKADFTATWKNIFFTHIKHML